MTADELTQYGTTFGPLGALALFVIREWRRSADDEPKKDPVLAELAAIKDSLASLDKRLAVVETILEERRR